MKIVIACFPASAIEIGVFDNIKDVDGPIHSMNVGYDDFYSTIYDLLEEYKTDEIIFYGPRDYVITLAKNLEENITVNAQITIMSNDDIEIDEEELVEEAMENEE